MGVHYLYTWVTKRYPLIRKEFDAELIPQIDHLYLDMNGVMYLCARDTSAVFKDSLCGKKMEEIFIEIVNYLNYIVNTIRPRKSLVISIDGVSPRCKIQNQRIRRFLSSMKQKSFNEFLQSNLKIPAGAINFKNNSITPGTDFMSELIEQIQFFIKRKFFEDSAWRKLKVVFSGGDVPGEGEHKTLDYIRHWKRGSDFDPNETHCIYGGDSDLVMLGLMTHLPNLMVLRESFPKMVKKIVSSATKRHSDPPKFEVIFISILREYLSLEFLDTLSTQGSSLERVIDDFIFFSYFVGNDFLHQIFCMNIKQGTFDRCLTLLQEHYRAKGDFLVKGIDIDYVVLLQMLKKMLPLEKQMIKATLEDFKTALKDLQRNKLYKLLPADTKRLEQVKKDVEKSATPNDFLEQFKRKIKEKPGEAKGEPASRDDLPVTPSPATELTSSDNVPVLQQKRRLSMESEMFDPENKAEEARESMTMKDLNASEASDASGHALESEVDREGEEVTISDVYLAEFWENFKKIRQARDNLEKILGMIEKKEDFTEFYYREYFGVKKDLETTVSNVCNSYLKGLNFVFRYYKLGCPSWTWFYKYPQAPLISSLVAHLTALISNKQEIKFEFTVNEPAPPFVQLMHVLPLQSLGLLPQPLAEAVVAESSPIKKYFPESYDFRPTDQVKEYTWEPVIKFIEEADMRKFVETFDWGLLGDQREKNKVGFEWLYRWSPKESLKVAALISGFDNFTVSISATPMPRRAQLTVVETDDYSYLPRIKKNVFPTLGIYDSLKLCKISRKNRDEMSLLIAADELKKLHVKFMNDFKDLLQENSSKEINVYFGQVYRKCYRLNRVVWFTKKDPEYARFTNSILEHFEDNYFFLPDQFKIQNVVEAVPCVSVSEPVFAHVTKNVLKNEAKVVVHKEERRILLPFCFVWIERGYESLNMHLDRFQPGSFSNTTLVSLLSGNLYLTGDTGKQAEVLRSNALTKNLNIKNDTSSFFQLEWTFIRDLGLAKEELLVFWLVLDSLRIDCDPEISSTAMLGDSFDIGLNFIHFLNRKVHGWTLVSDLVKIRLLPFKHAPNPRFCYYPAEKNKLYEVFLSQEAAQSVRDYFRDNRPIIDYLKQVRPNLIKQSSKGQMVKTSFSVKAVFPQAITSGVDVNIILFNIYASIMRQSHSSRFLHNSLSIYYTRETIESKLTRFQHDAPAQPPFEPSPFDTVADLRYNECLWPALSRKPDYHTIGDRVIVLSSHNSNAKFGELGTIIGVYKESIEVIFDSPFIGANDLCGRVPKFRGQILKFFDVFNLSSWSKDIVLKGNKFNNLWDGKYDIENFFEQLRKETLNIQ